ncbi:MAG: PEP/pyruvate-binding domain-containing protein [Planctomycetota bacterium]
MKRWIYFFGDGAPEIDSGRKDILGGKGASLVEMSHAGLPVPPGFIISTEACQAYFEGGNLWPEGLEAEVRTNLARLEKVTGQRFGSGKQPLFVSVRSGAAVSMPGMMDTILNCGVYPRIWCPGAGTCATHPCAILNCGIYPKLVEEVGDTPIFWRVYLQFVAQFAKTVHEIPSESFMRHGSAKPEDFSFASAQRALRLYRDKTRSDFPEEPWAALAACINAVFNSWNNERAIAYRKRNDIRKLFGTAVTVQSMFPSHLSGILFTQDPNNLAANRMIIEASYGLGEAVVSGDVTPDRFVVPRDNPAVYETVLGNKNALVRAFGDEDPVDPAVPCLSKEQVAQLCEAGLKIEKHFGRPQDIEWGFARGKFALLQCRSIRGLDILEDVERGRKAEIERLTALAKDRARVWVTHNLGETLRVPTPLTWDIVKHFMSGDGGFGLMYRQLGYLPSREVCRDGFLDLVNGRIYADPERLSQLFWEGMPMAYDLDAVLKDKNLLDQAPSRFDAERADGKFLAKLPKTVIAMLRSSRITKRMRRNAKEYFENEVLPTYLAYVKAKRGQDLTKRTTAEVVAELRERTRKALDEFGPESLKPGFFAGVAYGAVEGTLIEILGPEEGGALARTLTMGLDGDTTVEQNLILYRVAKGDATISEFLERFGHRAVGEMELAESRWREDSTYIEQMVATFKTITGRSPHDIHEENSVKRAVAEKSLREALTRGGGAALLEDIQANLKDAQALLPYRESGKHYLMMGYEVIRLAILELSRRWDLGRDVFFLRLDELDRYEAEKARLSGEIAARKLRWQSAQRLEMPDVIDSRNLEKLGLPQEYASATEFKGDAVASGVGVGPAAIVFDPREAGDIGTGYILVCPSTDPGWTALFINARGLIVERGGILSHGAIVARDFGIPAVVLPGATSRIPKKAQIRVDGNRGSVTVLDVKQS